MSFPIAIPLLTLGVLSALWKFYVAGTTPLSLGQDTSVKWLCWLTIYVICRIRRWIGRKSLYLLQNSQHDTIWSRNFKVWSTAAASVSAQIIQGRGIAPCIFPLITLVVYLQKLMGESRDEDALDLAELEGMTVDESPSRKPGLVEKSYSAPQRLFFVMGVVLSFLSLVRPIDLALLPIVATLSFLFLLGRVVWFIFIPRMSKADDLGTTPSGFGIDWDLLETLCLPSISVLTLVLALGVPGTFKPGLMICTSAALEASWWFVAISLTTNQLTILATITETIAASFDLSIRSTEQSTALLTALSAMTLLWQAATITPAVHRNRLWLCLLILIPLLGRLTHTGSIFKHDNLPSGLHPIEDIVLEARKNFSLLLSRQSENLEQATKEYHRRYGRDPPPRFSEWFHLAQQNDFALVDEFDTMMQSLEPFWGVPPSTLQLLCDNVLARMPETLLKYEVYNHKVSTSQGSRSPWFGNSMNVWLNDDWLALLPNMSLAINVYDEPSVCVPRDILDSVMQSTPSSTNLRSLAPARDFSDDIYGEASPRFLNLAAQDAWEAITLSCPVQSPARRIGCNATVASESIPFIRNITQSKDICEHCELQSLEAFLFAPETLHLTHSLVPIWSQGKPSSFNDILFPSPYYQVRGGDYLEAEDKDWELKDEKLYWVGAATGGHATESNWKKMQRQRLTLMTSSSSTESVQLLKKASSGTWMPYVASMASVEELFTTRIYGVTPQCEPAACEAEKTAFGIGNEEVKDSVGAAYDHKFLLDMDGNSFSGRFYRLLRSKSVVLKQAAFKEWHEDRIIPWVHFIPVSTSFVELPETMRFLATTDMGKKVSRQIANDSRAWARKTLRDVDLKLVWLRMLMEYGRIVDSLR